MKSRGSRMIYLSMNQDEILSVINGKLNKKIAKCILEEFAEKGLTYKVTLVHGDYYRIYCFIKKSKEALVINSEPDKNVFEIQFRIKDWRTFDKLDNYSDNIRGIILLNSTPCRAPISEGRYCRTSCPTMYQFIYRGKEYRLCHMLCSNFKLTNLVNEDIDSFLDIIKREIAFGMPRKNDN